MTRWIHASVPIDDLGALALLLSFRFHFHTMMLLGFPALMSKDLHAAPFRHKSLSGLSRGIISWQQSVVLSKVSAR